MNRRRASGSGSTGPGALLPLFDRAEKIRAQATQKSAIRTRKARAPNNHSDKRSLLGPATPARQISFQSRCLTGCRTLRARGGAERSGINFAMLAFLYRSRPACREELLARPAE